MGFTFGFCDGFDHYDPGGAPPTWATRTGAVTTTPGPYHGAAAVFAAGGTYLSQTPFGSYTSQAAMFTLRIHGATWGATAAVVPAQFWLFAVLKQSLVVYPNGRVAVVMGGPGDPELCSSAPGAFPMDAWAHVSYSTSLWESGPDASGAGGRADVFVNGTAVATVSGVATTGLPHRQSHVRVGNCDAAGGLVRLDVDDLAQYFTFATDTPEEEPPAGAALRHAVRTLYPVGAGDRTELGVGAGAGANWAVNAEPVGDGDASYVVKAAGGDAGDLYRMAPWPADLPAPPADADDPAYPHWGATGWGLLRDDGGAYRWGSFLLKYTDAYGDPNHFSRRVPLPAAGYVYVLQRPDWGAATLADLQLGWGMAPGDLPEAEDDAFAGSQVVLCVWYPEPVAPPEPPAGGARRWRVQWLAEA